jgi:hypothetical protein
MSSRRPGTQETRKPHETRFSRVTWGIRPGHSPPGTGVVAPAVHKVVVIRFALHGSGLAADLSYGTALVSALVLQGTDFAANHHVLSLLTQSRLDKVAVVVARAQIIVPEEPHIRADGRARLVAGEGLAPARGRTAVICGRWPCTQSVTARRSGLGLLNTILGIRPRRLLAAVAGSPAGKTAGSSGRRWRRLTTRHSGDSKTARWSTQRPRAACQRLIVEDAATRTARATKCSRLSGGREKR